MKRCFLLACILLPALLLAACSGPTPAESGNYSADTLFRSDISAYSENLSGIDNREPEADPNRKIIRNGSLVVESLSFDETLATLNTLVGATGGYIESSDISGVSQTSGGRQNMRRASLTVRIPIAQFSAFVNRRGELGNVLSLNTSSNDVTDQYFDTEARVKILNMEKQMLETEFQKTQVMNDRITLLDKIFAVQQEIEGLTGTLRKYDGLVAYSTVKVEIREVGELSASGSLGDRISFSFTSGMESFIGGFEIVLVWFSGALPFLLLLGGLGWVAYIVTRRILRWQAARPARPPGPAAPRPYYGYTAAPPPSASPSPAPGETDSQTPDAKPE